MPSEPSETVDAWTKLRSGGREPDALEIPTIVMGVETGFGPVRQSLGPNNEARLLLPMGEREQVPKLSDTAGLSIRAATYLLGRQPLRFMDLVCTDSRLEGTFAEVADEILKRIAEGKSSTLATATTIDDFRSLLTTPPSTSVETIVGLLGELIFLDRLLDISPLAWKSWCGPLSNRHDFRSSSLSVEVKSSLRVSSKVRISSLEQLLAPEGGKLYLFHCQLEPSAGGELVLGELAASVIRKSSSPNRVQDLLASVGCTDPNSQEWNDRAFNLEAVKTYSVCDGFPRITPLSFLEKVAPLGTSSVSYLIDLDQAVDLQLSEGAVVDLTRRIVDCLQTD